METLLWSVPVIDPVSLSDFVIFAPVIAIFSLRHESRSVWTWWWGEAMWQSIFLNSRMDCVSRQIGIAMTKGRRLFRMNNVPVFCKTDRLPCKVRKNH